MKLPTDPMYASICIHVQMVTHTPEHTQWQAEDKRGKEGGREEGRGRKRETERERQTQRKQSLQCFLVNLFSGIH